MKNFKNTNFLKALCMLFVVAIWNVSCSKEALEAKCSVLKTPISNPVDVPDRFETMLELVRTMDRNNNYDSMEKFHADFYGESEEALENLAFVKNEMDLYGKLGYASYVDKQLTDEIISDKAHKAFIDFSISFEKFVEIEPDLDEFKNFIAKTKSEINGKDLCADDKRLMNDFYSLVQGAGQYFYKHYSDDGKISVRGCNFWKGLLCFTLALIVAAIGTVVGIILFVGAVVTSGDKSGTLDEDKAAFLALALGIYLGFNFYKWCCGKDEVDVQVCEEPSGSYLQPTSCNGFRYTVFGPSDYGLTEWSNTNLIPGSVQTPTPVINVTVDDPNEDIAINADIACLEDGTTAVLYTWQDDNPDFDVPGGNVLLEWVKHPQSAAQQGSTHEVKVSTPNGVPYSYQWNVTNGNTISGSGNTVKVTYFNTGFSNISLKVTNSCTNQVQFLSGGTYVYQ